jgi:hypothetical protein
VTDPTPCPEPVVHGLGEVVVAFSLLEFVVSSCIWRLLGVEEDASRFSQAEILTSEMSFDRKVNAYANLFRDTYPGAHEKELKSVVGLLFTSQQKRNTMLHSEWGHTQQGFQRIKASAKARQGYRVVFEHTTASQLEDVRDFINAAAEALFRLSAERPLPETRTRPETPIPRMAIDRADEVK